MRLVRLGLGNINSTIGAVSDNAQRVIAACAALSADQVTIAALPEQVVGGYPPEDLLLWPDFVGAQQRALQHIAAATRELPMAFALGVLVPALDSIYNCAALCHRGQILGIVPKEKLPLYNVFYEARTLARGVPGLFVELDLGPLGIVPFGDLLFRFDFGTVALEVCEDMWSPDGPMRRRCYLGAELVLNLSASPFRIGMAATRREMMCTRTADNLVAAVYVNAVGANDGLVFDGGGFVAHAGRVVHEAPRFCSATTAVTIDLDRVRRLRSENTTWRSDRTEFSERGDYRLHEVKPGTTPTHDVKCPYLIHAREATASTAALTFPVPAHRSFFLPGDADPQPERTRFCEELLDAMALGVGDYFEKTGAFRQIGVALSGGRDSLLCLLIAHRYLRRTTANLPPEQQSRRIAEVLRVFYMPTRYSSQETRHAAEVAARELGVPFVALSIDEAFDREAEAARKMLQPGEELTALTLQNIQSRLRAQRMWNWSNAVGGLFLQTGNMSEKAVGYTTVGGDLMGCLAPIANLPKTVVNYLLDYLLATENLAGIRETIKIPATAELAPGQQDERDLMPYAVLDACLALHASEKLAPPEIAAVLGSLFPEYDAATLAAWSNKFVSLFARSIYKWVQAPLSLHLGNLDLERERALQLPVVTRSQWSTPSTPSAVPRKS